MTGHDFPKTTRLALALAALLALPATGVRGGEKLRYSLDIRPILSNCFHCHGPDEKHREAELRLDTRAGAVKDLGGRAAIVPGKPDESELLRRIATHDPDEQMPPPDSKRPALDRRQIALLRKWIAEGAEYEGHWAFLPLSTAAPPAVTNDAWARTPLDRFILERLQREGIAPAAEADRPTLIRRLSLDLLGLLPSPEEVADFVADADPRAYEKLVDRLLASPHYGERWGRHWLDQARYADSNGYTIDSERAMWPYRDWVIKALNDDMPFDQFTIEQLAGDLLPSPSKSQLAATAFHRNTLINEEGGTDKEQFRHEAVVDRVNTTGAVWLGLTIGCAQCHTHKFDPITHREYYEMFAFFNQGFDVNNKGATVPYHRGEIFGQPAPPPPPPEDDAPRQLAWEKAEIARAGKQGAVAWSPLEYTEYDTQSGAGFTRLEDNSLLSDGRGAFNDTYRVVAKTKLGRVAAVRLKVLTHDSLPKGGPGRAGNGNFVLTDFNLAVAGQDQPFATVVADHEQPGYPVTAAIDDAPESGWAINVGKGSPAKMNADHEAVFTLSKPAEPADGTLEFHLFHDLNESYLVGRFSLEVTDVAPGKREAVGADLLAALQAPGGERSDEQKKSIRAAFERFEKENLPKKKAVTELASADVVELMVMKELDKPRATYIALRGDFLRPDKELGPLEPGVVKAIPPALAAVVDKSSDTKRSRLDLARWLVSAENPLTPRVTMNRVWLHYFGRGLVETEEDFGAQGAPPSHPELLDWLAGELIRQRWRLKAMHRLIVTSATYRQSSHTRPNLAERDPRNLWLARQSRLRIEAEIVRDAALSASGLLNPVIGGPSVRPPQPEGVYSFTQNAKKWVADAGANRYRRGMYTAFFRSAPYPLFTTFDSPDFQTVCTRRPRSNTPLQALTVANDTVFLELAQGLAARVLREAPSDDADLRLRRAAILCWSREPSTAELAALRGYYDRRLAEFAADPAQTKSLLTANLEVSQSKPEVSAALTCVARALINTDEFITRE